MRVLATIVPEEGGRAIRAEDGSTLAMLNETNLFASEELPAIGDHPVVCWSGWLGEALPDQGWFERVPGQWLPSSRAAWDQVSLAADRHGLILRPHARHLLSDGPGCLNWLRAGEGRRLLLDPATMLEPEMLPDADDHIRRLLVTVAPLAWGLVVSDVGLGDSSDRGPWCVPVPAGTGSIDMKRFADLIAEFVPETCVLVGQSEPDLALLRTLA